ncbi:MAG: hypothetical protein ACQESR_08875, partial [Planctomycetota bacterium]
FEEFGVARIWDVPSLSQVAEYAASSPLSGKDGLVGSVEPFMVSVMRSFWKTFQRLSAAGLTWGHSV